MSDHPRHPHGHGDRPDPGAPPPVAPAPAPDVSEDSAAQALSDALRSSFAIVRVIMVLLVIVFFASGLKTIEPQELGLKLRFGRPVGEGQQALLGPGLHWAFPYPIDEVVRIPIGQVQTITSSAGWYATTAAQAAAGTEPPPGPSLNPALDGYTLTADGNIIHVRATLSYRISDPLRYVFGFAAASNLVENALNNAIMFASGQFTVDNALTRDITAFKERIRARLDHLIQSQQLGITIDQVDLVAIPPRFLKDAFDAVARADATRGKVLNEARTYATATIARAQGDAAGLVSAGEGDRARLVATVAEEAQRFQRLQPAHQRNPEFFVRQLQLETLQRVLTNAQENYFLPQKSDGPGRELRLLLSRELQKPKAPEPPAPREDRH
ncbi:MAG TPA: protease modulator HflK [Methylomirabilota bacterium]|nr:protease modulator HflK [Methylomirabilota bacterium]